MFLAFALDRIEEPPLGDRIRGGGSSLVPGGATLRR